jgi:protease-4
MYTDDMKFGSLLRSSVSMCAHLWLIPLTFLLAGCGMPSLLITPVPNANKMEEIQVQPGNSDKIAVIEVEGMLMNARAGGFLQPGENPLSVFTQQLDQAEKDSHVKAVVLRVNSPGGTVTTSDAMYQEIERFKAKTHKPVVASCQEVAASGAFYVSCASDWIMAQPTSVVGSIGVIFNTFNFTGTMAKIGATSDAIKSGPLKDMGSPFKPMTDQERHVMQGIVNEYYARFLHVIRSSRRVPETSFKTCTDGRVFSGKQGQALGLVDELGLLEDAIDVARKMSHSPKASAIMYKRPYGYRGSIYAEASIPTPQASADSNRITRLELPGGPLLPSGFYYLWKPGI